MNRSYFLICLSTGRQFGFFDSLDDAENKALEVHKRSHLKMRYSSWRIIECVMASGHRIKVAEYLYVV